MPDRTPDSEQLLMVLAETPRRIALLTEHLPPGRLVVRPEQDEWSLNEVLAHLRACADVWGSCIATIATQDTPTIRAISPRTFIRKTAYPDQSFLSSLGAFAGQRAELLRLLATLSPEDWYRRAMVKGAGRVLEHTVLDYADRLADHERQHLKQVASLAEIQRQL